MSRKRRYTPPFEVAITGLGPGGTGLGEHEGTPVRVRGAPPGSVVRVAPFRRKAGVLHARRLELIQPPPDAAVPRCAVFGLCGGCVLQELSIEAQRTARQELAQRELGSLEGVEVHPIRAGSAAYGYRNKVELSYGTRRYLSEEAHQAGGEIEGRWLGFHAPGRFNRVVDSERCELVPEGLNEVITVARRILADSPAEPWDVRAHTGFWRHLVLRHGQGGERLVALHTAPPGPGEDEEPQRLADALPGVTGVVWHVSESVADAAIGPQRAVLSGRPFIEERLGSLRIRLSASSFFQASSRGAEVLYDVVGQAVGRGQRLLDLYCGTGTIGLYLADRFQEIVGIEQNEQAVADARANAEHNGVGHVRFEAGKVEELAAGLQADAVVVDPPRAGLHPKASAWLAGLDAAKVLVYVACKPASLGRDRAILEAGGWRLRELWTVDLFPQTGHVEAVARFER